MRNPFISVGIILLLTCICIICANAQPVFDLAQVSCQYGPPTSVQQGSAGTEVNTFFTGFNAPLRINPRNRIVLHTFYDRRRVDFEEEETVGGITLHHAGLPSRFDLQAAVLNTSFQHTLRDTSQNIVFAVSARHYASVGTPVSNLSVTPSAALLYTRRRSDRFAWKTGVYMSREFFGFFWLPLLGVDWQAGNRLWVWGILPRHLVADYRLTPAWHLTLSYRGVTDSYRVGEKNWLAQLEGQLRIGNEFYIPHSPLVLVLESGRSLFRNLRYYDAISVENIRPKASDSWYLRAGLNLRIITNDAFGVPGGPKKK